MLGLAIAAALAMAAVAPLSAADLPDDGWLAAYADVDLAGADGPRSWLDRNDAGSGGTGKARFGNADGDALRLRPYLTEAGVVFQPKLGWSIDGLVSVLAQHDQDRTVDLSEAYLRWRPLPIGGVKLSARAGIFWPPVSLEHDGGAWQVRNTVTPSAIDSWIGEEVKVAGVEATAATTIGRHRLALTVAAFGLDDTAGTLLTFRGWALHDEKATLFGYQPLPVLNAFIRNVQDGETRTMIDLDHRVGWYGKLRWAPPGPVEFQYFHYDNRGDPTAFDAELQWAWRTRFDHLGATLDAGERTHLIAQAISGSTVMGFRSGGRPWVDMRFRSAFLLASRTVAGGDRPVDLSARIKAFDTRNRGSKVASDDDETGWALTGAVRRPISDHLTLLAEALHIDSRRDARLREDAAPRQQQTILRLSLRLQNLGSGLIR